MTTTLSILDRPAADAATLLAWRIESFGSPETMRLTALPLPSPGPGEVRLRIQAAGVGPWDAWVRAGRSALPQPLPLTLGSDVAGEVEQVGPGVTGFAPGDQVFGLTNPRFTGGYATHGVFANTGLAHRPSALSTIEAASVPVVAVTAWQALFEQARIRPGQTVLVHGAAGNVGAYAVQLAALSGARVLATAHAADLDAVRRLGAAAAFDCRAVRFEECAGPVDAVIDLVGGDVQARSFAVLRRGGVLVSAVVPPDLELARRHGVRAEFFLVDVTTARLERLAGMFAAGVLSPRVGTVLPMAEAQIAHDMLEGRRPKPRGKIVLRVE